MKLNVQFLGGDPTKRVGRRLIKEDTNENSLHRTTCHGRYGGSDRVAPLAAPVSVVVDAAAASGANPIAAAVATMATGAM